MAKRWGVAVLLHAMGPVSRHAMAVLLDMGKPFKPQAR